MSFQIVGNPEGQHERSYLWAIWAYQNSPHVLMVTLAARWRLLQHKIFSQAAKKLQKFDGLIANLNFSRSITNFPAWPAQILSAKKIKDARLIEYFFHGVSRCEKMERAKKRIFRSRAHVAKLTYAFCFTNWRLFKILTISERVTWLKWLGI